MLRPDRLRWPCATGTSRFHVSNFGCIAEIMTKVEFLLKVSKTSRYPNRIVSLFVMILILNVKISVSFKLLLIVVFSCTLFFTITILCLTLYNCTAVEVIDLLYCLFVTFS